MTADTHDLDPLERKKPARWASVYENLRDAIVAHRLAPGTKLPEDEIASIYSVSRTIVRSALQALAHDRLASLEPNRGAFVAKPTKREAREVFEARSLVEPHIAALASYAINREQADMLRLHLEKEQEAIRAGRDSDAIALSAKFHIAIAEIADHSILTEFVRDLVSRSSLIVALYWRRHDTTCESHAHHALVDAIAASDAAKASEMMRDHLVDLLSGLDLSPQPASPQSTLSDILGG